jgi:hypothetical protein
MVARWAGLLADDSNTSARGAFCKHSQNWQKLDDRGLHPLSHCISSMANEQSSISCFVWLVCAGCGLVDAQ